jgi:hypoxanthine phosphoribosyltransferase
VLPHDPHPIPDTSGVTRMDLDDISPELAGDIESVLISADEIDLKLRELAARVEADYAGKEILLVGVLKGAFVVMADFARHVKLPVSTDFMACSSYGTSTRSSGVVRILKDLDTDIEGKHVLLVEDIIDSGLTLDYLVKNLRSRKPASIEVMTLLTKPTQRKVELPVKYVGFEVPDVFVVGYGLDFAERFRNVPFIATLKSEAYT